MRLFLLDILLVLGLIIAAGGAIVIGKIGWDMAHQPPNVAGLASDIHVNGTVP